MSRTQPRVIVPQKRDIFGDDVASRLRRVRILAKLLDNSIAIPGTRFKFGLDPIIGLVPGVGDALGAVLSGYIVLEAARLQVPPFTLVRMLVNIGIDTVLGSIPAAGDLFDAVWKSNLMNVALLEQHLGVRDGVGRENRSATRAIVLSLIVLLLILVAGLALGVFAARLLWGLWTR